MASRPNMQARNSSGKRVSLLHDDCAPRHESRPSFRNPQYSVHTSMVRSSSNASRISTASSPRTPGLLRSDSCDSQTTNDPVSPITPVFMTDYGAHSSYTSTSTGFLKNPAPHYEERHYEYPYPSNQQYSMPVRPSYAESRQPSYADSQYEEEGYGDHNGSERGTKRYPCRFRDLHHCEKTFTTSGHASRHSKIHTAEKAVHCTYQGCQKKFTRADNMKQHLETHYKIKNGSSSSSSSSHKASSSRPLTMSASIRKPTPSQASGSPGRNLAQAECGPYDPALYAVSAPARYAQHPAHHMATASSSVPYGALDMGGVHSALMSRPIAARTDGSSAGLDVLANIAALQ